MVGIQSSAFIAASFILLCMYHAVEGAGEGREFAVNAVAYRTKYNTFLNLGDCVNAASSQGGVTTAGLNMVGTPVFRDNQRTDLQFHRLNTMLDSLHRTMAGVSYGIDLLGLVGAEVEGTVTVTIKTKRNTVTMEATLKVSRGMHTLRDARPSSSKPISEFKSKCPYYLSEIVYGGEERLIVHMEFETVEKTTEFELKVTVKILFFKISVKMRFMFTDNSASGKVKVVRISSYQQNPNDRQQVTEYSASDITLAMGAVVSAENAMEQLPAQINSMDISQIHETYFFAKAVVDNSYAPGLMTNQWAYQRAKYQYYELDTTLSDIDADINAKRTMTSSQSSQLQTLKTEVKSKRDNMKTMLANFRGDNINAILAEYGESRAPGYYRRKHKQILPDQQYLVCVNKGMSSTAGTQSQRGVSMEECESLCDRTDNCRGFSWRASDRTCTLLNSSACPSITTQSGVTYVKHERSNCGNPSGCSYQAFVAES